MAETNKSQNIKKFVTVALFSVGVFLLLVLAILVATGQLNKVDPMAQYKIQRQCTFMSDTNVAYCTDGTKWNVTNVTPPLP